MPILCMHDTSDNDSGIWCSVDGDGSWGNVLLSSVLMVAS